MKWLSNAWSSHGTKILGTLTTIGAACNGGDHYLTQILTNGEHAIVSLSLTIVGAMTIQRGFDNSKRLQS
jgi:hypothetical protein